MVRHPLFRNMYILHKYHDIKSVIFLHTMALTKMLKKIIINVVILMKHQ